MSFFHIIRVNTNLVVAGPKIKLCEKPDAMEFIEQLFHHRNWKFTLDSALVESSIIHAESPGFVRFLNEQHRRGERRCTRANGALCQHGRTVGFKLILLELWITI
jgi:hypothetical protein